jgi:hypothetical protein
VLGISPSPPSTDTVVFVRQDGAVVLHALANAQEQVLLDPGTYNTSGDNVLVTILFPARLSPDGQWLLVPTPDRGTWLTSLDGQVRRQVSEQLLSFTWAPDSRRIVFTRRGGQVESERDREVYVQDVVEGQEPRLLARLPDRAGYPAWSPGGDSAESVAAYSCESYACAIWLIDVSSGHVRELGQFAPLPMMATPDMIHWSPDGTAVQVSSYPGALIFPIDGGGPLPCAIARGERRGTLSPDGALAAWAEAVPDADRRSRLTVARTETDRRVTYGADFEHVERLHWTDDGRRLLVRTYDRGQRLWTVDPAVGEPDLVAEHIFYLGTPKQLQQRSTQASTPVVTPRVMPEAGDPDTWRAYGVTGWPLCLRVPPTWRIGTRGDPHTGEIWEVTVANFGLGEQEGVVALTEALLEVSFEYRRPPAEGAELSLDQMRGAESRYATVESTTLDGRRAIRIRPLVSPVSEEMRVQLDSGQLWITYQPLSSTQQVVLEQLLASIDLDRPCAPDLVIEAYALEGSPQVEPLAFEPVQGTAQEILQKRGAERERRVKRVWKTSGEMSAAFREGRLVATEIYTNTDEGQVGAVQVTYGGSVLYTVPLGLASPVDKLRGLWVHEGHWYLEVADWQGQGQIIRDGTSLNEGHGYEETFGFQVLYGRPFWFFRREGQVGVSFDSQETLLGFDHVPHNGCCSIAELNPVQAENMVAFFGLRDGTWHYVEVGVYE